MYTKMLLVHAPTEPSQSDRTGINDHTKGYSGMGIPSQPVYPELSPVSFGQTEHEAIFLLQRGLMMK